MVSFSEVSGLALSYEGTDESPHFEIISFRVKKKIFATLNKTEGRACLKLSLIDQDVFCTANTEIIYPVPNAWGKYGWTLVNLKRVRKPVFRDALNCAYCNVAPAALSKKYQITGKDF
ncbi:MAG: MmcQ/YjbR family DNA-binding protein [Bacteroidota bacterium]|nr:MmcQ/YjbR family DNA-binding protein [Bacteroidota bacterium]